MDREKLKQIRRELVLSLAYPFFVLVMIILWIMPDFLRKYVDRWAGGLYYKYSHKARAVAFDNLRSAFPDKSDSEIWEMTYSVFSNVASTLLDFFSFVWAKDRRRFFKYIEVEGEQHLQQAYEKGKGVICLIPHISSWELSAVTPPMLGFPTVAASKPIKGYLVQKTMVWFRARRGMKNFDRQGSYAKLSESLHKGNCLILMIDQDTKVKGCFVDFFGRQTFTPMGASRLALETGASVVPMAMNRIGVNRYKFTIYPELPLHTTSATTNDNLLQNTQNQSYAIEEIIRKNPTQWVWMHRRWKTTPQNYPFEYIGK